MGENHYFIATFLVTFKTQPLETAILATSYPFKNEEHYMQES